MSDFNPKVDEYFAKSEEFAIPIMEYLRQIIHDTCPDVVEVMKWGFPHFDYKGDMMCILGSFKKHCSFSLYKAELMVDPKIAESVKAGQKMGYLDKIKSVSDLPEEKVLVAYIKEAMTLNEKGIKKVKPKTEPKQPIEIPDYFSEKLALNPKAKEIFESQSPSFRKEYLVWIIDAKTDATRQKRIEESLEWITEGKGRFWKYKK